jgi:hypothetical protein
MAVLPLAVGGCTLKDMDSMAVDIFNTRGAFEEDVDGRNPILREAIWE